MKLYEYWQQQYLTDRYLEYLSDVDLKQRAKDIFVNVLTITNNSKVGLHPPETSEGQYWMRCWTETLYEFQLRFGPYPAGFTDGSMKDANIPHPSEPIIARANKIINDKNLKTGTYLVKYGSKKYLEPILQKGELRVSPASYYKDPSLNHAINDDELSCSVQLHPSKVKLEAFDKITKKSKGILTPKSNVAINFGSNTDYYVFCLSTVLLPRLFVDFSADSCLLITNPPQFLLRLSTAVDNMLSCWEKYLIDVSYFDPLKPDKKKIDSFSCKHFRYSYQKEWRLIWLPPENANILDHINIEFGNCEDVCELIKP